MPAFQGSKAKSRSLGDLNLERLRAGMMIDGRISVIMESGFM
jgi:hypothetical protein